MTAAAVAGLYAAPSKASTSVQVWGLDPSGGDHDACGCSACRACNLHAANKLFASISDAGANRAHAFCKCAVVPLALVDQTVYNALFVNGGARASVDRRSAWVQQALVQVPTVAAPTDLVVGSPVDVPASLVRVQVHQNRRGGRVLQSEVYAARNVAATLTLMRGRERLGHRRITRVKGRETLELAVPSNVRPGRAHLRLQLEDAAGRRKFETREIHIPRALTTSTHERN